MQLRQRTLVKHSNCRSKRASKENARALSPPRASASEATSNSSSKSGRSGSVKELVCAVASIGVPGLLNACIEPCTSFAETAAVGQVGGAHSLAAFSPGGAFFSTTEELSATLGVAVTSAVSARTGDSQAQNRLIRTLALNAAFLGLTIGLSTVLMSSRIATALGADQSLVALAREYISIRALAIPGFLLAMTAEGALVGANHPWVPLRVYIFTGAMNLLCLGVLVEYLGVEPLRAVAIAAVLAHCSSGALMTSRLRIYSLVNQVSKDAKQYLSLDELFRFARLAGSMLAGAAGRVLVLCSITVAVNKAGVMPAAAHKLAQETYWLLGCFTEPLFVSVAALVPRYLASSPRFARKLALTSVGIAFAVGGLITLPSTMLVCTPFFTKDAAVLAELSKVAPHVGTSLMLAAVVYALEGILVGIGDVRHLTKTHILNAVVVCSATFGAFEFGSGLSISRGWLLMVIYLGLRLVQHSYRLVFAVDAFKPHRQKKTNGGALLDTSATAEAVPSELTNTSATGTAEGHQEPKSSTASVNGECTDESEQVETQSNTAADVHR